MRNLNARRGRVEHLEPLGNSQSIKASVPLSEMFGYATDLRVNGPGARRLPMQFDRYEDVPPSIAAEIVDAQGRVGAGPEGDPKRNGQAEVRAHEAARQRRHDQVHRPREDDPDRGDPGARRDGHRYRAGATSPRSTRLRASSAASRSTPRTSSTRPRTATTRTSTARGTPTTSRT